MTHFTLHNRWGQAILEYLLIAGGVLAAVLAVRNAVVWKTWGVSGTAIDQVNAIRQN